jgi:WD40 repeat protein/predicted AAA+ superfamily ATPase
MATLHDSVTPATTKAQSPFQLLSAFDEGDEKKFFGRERETKILYQSVQESNVVLIYGESGTGKTSLVRCGLVNETRHFNWTTITVRRFGNINQSLVKALKNHFDNNDNDPNGWPIARLMKKVFLSNFQPMLLIFDQFEELFIFGTSDEINEFAESLKEIFEVSQPWKMVFVIREDYLAKLSVIEKAIPGLFRKRMRVESMDLSHCREVVVKSSECEGFEIQLSPIRKNANGKPDYIYSETHQDLGDVIVKTVANIPPNQGVVHLPYLQVFLDTLWKKAYKRQPNPIVFDASLVEEVGNMGNVLEAFLEEKVKAQSSLVDENGKHLALSDKDTWKFLALFVSPEGTTNRQKVRLTDYTAVPMKNLLAAVKFFSDSKILAPCTDGNYELAHESLVPIIQNKKHDIIRKRLDEKEITIHGNPYKGLQSFDTSDCDRFYGRKEAKAVLLEKIKQSNYLVIVGNSGAGKSSLIKAGLFPELEKEGYKILKTVRAGDMPLENIERSLAEIYTTGENAFALLIDQYEELITRIRNEETRKAVYAKIHSLLEAQKKGLADYKLKIIMTVRADFEPQFRLRKPLDEYWKAGKYMVPPFSRQEIREVIIEPAYQAGLEFSPPSLADEIADEVYSSQATGLLPLMSYTLSEIYKAYKTSGRNDRLLTKNDYENLGGVIGGLQNRADQIYQGFKKEHPTSFKGYQFVMQNIILRMVYISAGEFAGRRVSREELEFGVEGTDKIKEEILGKLIESHLIVSGDDGMWYEPAHDVLVKSWAQVWVWIDSIGEDGINVRNGLSQAANEYRRNKKHQSYLWDKKPRLDDLVPLLANPQNSWLNKWELAFVEASKEKRDKDRLSNEQEKEEKLRLMQEKYEQQQMNGKLMEEKVAVQKQTIKRIRRFRTVVLIAFVIAATSSVIAYLQMKKASQNFNQVEYERMKVLELNRTLGDKNDILQKLNTKNAELANKSQKAAALATAGEQNAIESKAFAERESAKALAAQKSAMRLANQLNDSILALQLARIEAVQKGDEFRKFFEEEKRLRNSLQRQLHLIDSTSKALNIQKEQNITQLLAISKRLQQTDMVKAFRLSELAYKKDSSNKDAFAQYNSLSKALNYFYINKEFVGDNSGFSPDGKLFFVYASLRKSLVLYDAETFKARDSIYIEKGLISLGFSPRGEYILAVYKNNLVAYPVNNVSKEFDESLSGIISASFSPIGKGGVVTAEKGLYLWPDLSKGLIQLKSQAKNRMISVVFSPDGQRLLCEGEKQDIYIIEATTGKQLDKILRKDTERAFFSPKGSHFIVSNQKSILFKDFSIFNSKGEKISFTNLDEYGSIESAVFSDDGSKVLLTLIKSSISEKQQQQQQQQIYSSEKTFVLLALDENRAQMILGERINEFMNKVDIAFLPNGSPNIMISGNMLLIAQPNGLIRMIDIETGKEQRLAGHDRPIRSISISPSTNHILTSSANYTTKLWQLNIPLSLDSLRLLPQLSAEDLKQYGNDK